MKKMGFKIVEIFFTLLSIIVCISGEKYNGYEMVYLIPFVYLICMIFIKYKNSEYKNNIAYITIDILTFIKYSVMPMLIVIMKDYNGGVLTRDIPASNYVQEAIFFSVIECFIVFFTVYVYNLTHKENIKIRTITEKIKIGPVMLVTLGLSFIFILKYSASFFPSQLFVIDTEYNAVQIESSIDGLIKILFTLTKMFLLLYGTQYLAFKYNKKQKFIYVIEIMLLLLIYLGINTSTSRWGLVIPIIVYLHILKDIWFKKQSNKIAIGVIISVLLVSFISISLYKFQWLFDENNSGIRGVTTVLASQIQEYISGPRAIAQGIETAEVYSNEISAETLFNDFAGSIPYFSKYVNQKDRINIYYNYVVKGNNARATQIMPTISIGYAYFGYIGCFIFTILFIVISLSLGVISSESNNIFKKFIFSYMSIWSAMCLGFNTQIIFGFFISTVVPFILIYELNQRLCFKKDRKKVKYKANKHLLRQP